MPINKNALKRIKLLDGMLSDRHHYYNIHDLTEAVNRKLLEIDGTSVSERTIEDDINFIERQPFGMSILRESRGGKNAILYEDRATSVFKKDLSDDEKNLLNEVLNTIGQFDGLDNFEWLDGLREKLENEGCERRIISFSSNPYLKNKTLLGELFTAISSKLVIRLQYRPYNGEMHEVVVYPYLLKQYNNRWFLIGGVVRDDFIGNYPLDRIEGVEVVYDMDYKDCEEDLDERFENIVGVTVYQNRKEDHIICWVSNERYPYIETKPLHGTQKLIKNEKEYALRERYPIFKEGRFISLDCIYNKELIQLLCSFGSDLIVVEPMSIREEMEDIVIKTGSYYQAIRENV